MRIAFKEDRLAKSRVRLKVALVDANPLMDEFILVLGENKFGQPAIDIKTDVPEQPASGIRTANSFVIFDGVVNSDRVSAVKALIKSDLGIKIRKYKLDNGLSEDKVKW